MLSRLTSFQLLAFAVVAAVSLTLGSTPARADWHVGRDFRAADRVPLSQIDHSGWDRLLKEYVDDRGRVDYARWQADGTDELDRYLNKLSQASMFEAGEADRLAYWINAYNAVTIRGILREYPTTSIRNHTAKLFGYNIWDDLFLRADGRDWSLNTIEHKVLRPMGEPRIHFAIVCASVGCPKLRNEAYLPGRIDTQLEKNARHFFRQRQNLRFGERTIFLSSILDWFGEDFGSDQTHRLGLIAKWVPAEDRSRLLDRHSQVRFLDYDWSLNSQPASR